MTFNHKHLIDIREYSEEDLTLLLDTAERFRAINERRIKKVPVLKGYTVVNMFNEPSTRTRSSFEIAEKRLSCDTLNFGGSSTSTVKGESLDDTVETLCSYKIDMIVVRDRHAGVPQKVARKSGVSVILDPRAQGGLQGVERGHRRRHQPLARVRIARSLAQDHGREGHAHRPGHLASPRT